MEGVDFSIPRLARIWSFSSPWSLVIGWVLHLYFSGIPPPHTLLVLSSPTGGLYQTQSFVERCRVGPSKLPLLKNMCHCPLLVLKGNLSLLDTYLYVFHEA